MAWPDTPHPWVAPRLIPERTTSCDGQHPGWYDWTVNNDHICEGQDWTDPHPTERHRRVPDNLPTPDWA